LGLFKIRLPQLIAVHRHPCYSDTTSLFKPIAASVGLGYQVCRGCHQRYHSVQFRLKAAKPSSCTIKLIV